MFKVFFSRENIQEITVNTVPVLIALALSHRTLVVYYVPIVKKQFSTNTINHGYSY